MSDIQIKSEVQLDRVIVIGVVPKSLVNFRGDLLKKLSSMKLHVIGMAGSYSKHTDEFILSIGGSYQVYPVVRRNTNPFSDIKTYRFLKNYFVKQQPKLILAYTIKPIIWSGFAIRNLKATNLYAMVEGTGFALQGGGWYRNLLKSIVIALYRLSLSKANKVIFLNPDNMQSFINWKIIPKDKAIIINGIGVNLKEFSSTAIPDGEVSFLSIGRLLGEKGFREYAQAAKLVKDVYPNIIFNLLGQEDPSTDGIPLEEVRNWEKQGILTYFGYSPDVRSYLKSCHIFVLPSYHEGMPRTVLEAMAIGRPILTTDVPGCRETVMVGENGFLVPKKNAEALAEKMIWFIENKNKLDQMGACSRNIATEKYNVEHINNRIVEIMDLK